MIVATVSAISAMVTPPTTSVILHLREKEKLSQREAIKRLTEMPLDRNDTHQARHISRAQRCAQHCSPAESWKPLYA